VSIDIDGDTHIIDAYRASGGGWGQTLFSASGLSSASHVLTMTVLGTKKSASCGSWVYVDAFDITAVAPTGRLQEGDSAVTEAPTSWAAGDDARAGGGRYVASSVAHSYVTVTFTGTGISWVGMADSCSGQAVVSIDGVSQIVDAYRASGAVWQQTLFVKGGLPAGAHTFRLTVLGTKQPSSCGPWIYVDYFDVFP
jgi:hypothetical protein